MVRMHVCALPGSCHGHRLCRPRPLYLQRNPQASNLWRLLDEHFDSFRQVYDECFQEKYGYWRPIVEQSVAAFLKCGDLQEGFARVRCPDCKHEMFVAFSCKQRCTCPSCHQKVSVHHGQVAGQPVELSARSRFCLAAMIRLALDTFFRSAL